jgi:hypothetical protein
LNENASQSQLLSSSANNAFVYKLFSWLTSMNKYYKILRLQHICCRHSEWLFSLYYPAFFFSFFLGHENIDKRPQILYNFNYLDRLGTVFDGRSKMPKYHIFYTVKYYKLPNTIFNLFCSNITRCITVL